MTELRKYTAIVASRILKIRLSLVVRCLACVLVGAGLVHSAWGAEDLPPFRVDSLVFAGKVTEGTKRPERHQVSLIVPTSAGIRAYDFRWDEKTQQPIGEITVYDAARQRYCVIDLPRQLRMEMAQDDVAQLVVHAHTLASHEKGLVHVAATGKFEQETWETPQRLVLAASSLTYHTEIDATPAPQAVLAYQRFADAFARWNTVRTGLPPAARVMLNEKIASHNGVPKYVELTADFPGTGRVSQHSRHVFAWHWSPSDEQLVDRFDEAMEKYRRVAPLEFLQASAPQAAKAPKR